MTNSPGVLDTSVMMSSVMPSAKYSCSGSPDMLVNGSTASEGFSGGRSAGSGGAGAAAGAVCPAAVTRKARTG